MRERTPECRSAYGRQGRRVMSRERRPVRGGRTSHTEEHTCSDSARSHRMPCSRANSARSRVCPSGMALLAPGKRCRLGSGKHKGVKARVDVARLARDWLIPSNKHVIDGNIRGPTGPSCPRMPSAVSPADAACRRHDPGPRVRPRRSSLSVAGRRGMASTAGGTGRPPASSGHLLQRRRPGCTRHTR